MNKVAMSLIVIAAVSVCILLADNETDEQSYQKHGVLPESNTALDTDKRNNEGVFVNNNQDVKASAKQSHSSLKAKAPEKQAIQNDQQIVTENRSLIDFAKISNDQDWITEIAVNADDKSYDRVDNITQFIALNENLADRDYQVECGEKLCGLLFSHVENEADSEQIIDIFRNAEVKGSFIHYFSKLQDDGWYTTRITLPKNSNESALNFGLSEL